MTKILSKIILPAALVSSLFLLNGCESEAIAKLNEACSKYQSDRDGDNREACRNAILINCGGMAGYGLVERCVDNPEKSYCAVVPSYCIDNMSKQSQSRF